jgi:hypothetical protein
MNDDERRLWVLNDETLYGWWMSTHTNVWEFIKKHRGEIDAHIKAQGGWT